MTKLAGRITTAIVLGAWLCAANTGLFAQGCSDAGFCSVGSVALHSIEKVEDPSFMLLTVGLAGGIGDYKIVALTPKLELAFRFENGTQVSSRLTMQTVSGVLGTQTGFGDVYLTVDHPLFSDLHLTAGVKVPLMNANAQIDGRTLPMDYQSSLGTIDVIAGISFTVGAFAFSAATQVPLVQNENTFDPKLYPDSSAAQQYHSTMLLERTADMLVRVSYEWTVSERISIVPSVLPIVHLANDTYQESIGKRSEINGSSGLTVNAAVLVTFNASDQSSFGLTLAAPFVTREARPDGLTRKFIAAVEYSVQL